MTPQASPIVQLVKSQPAMQEARFDSGSGRSPGDRAGCPLQYSWASLVARLAKNPPATRETWVQSLGKERLPTPVFWPGECHGLYSPRGCKESDTTEQLSLHFSDPTNFPNP